MTEITRVETKPLAESPTESMIRIALERGLNPTELYAILREERGDQRRMAFNRAKAKFQLECPPVPKTGINPQFRRVTSDGLAKQSTFASLDKMQEIAHPHLVANGFSTDFGRDLEYEAAHPGHVCPIFILRHEAGHEETYPGLMPIPKPTISNAGKQVQSECQCVGIALEFGRRQAYRMGTGIRLIGEDTDGNADVGDDDGHGISVEQQQRLNDLVIACEEFDKAARTGLLGYMKAASLAEIRAGDFPKAEAALLKKLERRK